MGFNPLCLIYNCEQFDQLIIYSLLSKIKFYFNKKLTTIFKSKNYMTL